MMPTSATAQDGPCEAIRRVVGPEFVRTAGPGDAVDGVSPRWVVEPADAAQVAAVLAAANAAGLRVVPRGGGTKLDWGNPPRAADLVLSARRLDRVLEHTAGDMTATVEAGCTVESLQATLAANGQRLALDPLWPERATVGGVLATNDSGSLRVAFGSLRDLIIGITVALPDGTLARSGGKVVKNVAGYDLPKLFTGSFGTLGVITQATFRLHPLPHAVRNLAFSARDWEGLARLAAALAGCSLVTAAVQIIAGADAPPVAYVRVEGLPQAIGSKSAQVVQAATAAGSMEQMAADGGSAREALYADAASIICKVSVLPTQLAGLCQRLAAATVEGGPKWRLVAQVVGTGLLRLTGADAQRFPADVAAARGEIARLGGSLVVLRCPPDLKRRIDVWGECGDALPLMRRVKEQFDPAGILNPGRFVGGI